MEVKYYKKIYFFTIVYQVNIFNYKYNLGNTPEFIFMAIVPTKSLTGDVSSSSTDFRDDRVSEINIKLNGNSVHGYPMKIAKNYPIWPYWKYNEVTNRTMNVDCSKLMSMTNFKNNTFYAHKFEAEETLQGWISLNMTLDTMNGYSEPRSLGKF